MIRTVETTTYEIHKSEHTLRVLFIDPWARGGHVEFRIILPSGDVLVRHEGDIDTATEVWIDDAEKWGTVGIVPATDEASNCVLLPAADARQIAADLGLTIEQY